MNVNIKYKVAVLPKWLYFLKSICPLLAKGQRAVQRRGMGLVSVQWWIRCHARVNWCIAYWHFASSASGDASLPPCWKYIWWDVTCSQGPTQGLRIFVGQVSPMGEGCGLSVNTVTWIHGDRFGRRSHWHSFTGSVHSVAPSNALAGLYGSHGRGRPLHWSWSYNGTCEIWTDAALLSVFHMILLWHFPLRSRLALLSRDTPTEFLYTYTKVLFTYSCFVGADMDLAVW